MGSHLSSTSRSRKLAREMHKFLCHYAREAADISLRRDEFFFFIDEPVKVSIKISNYNHFDRVLAESMIRFSAIKTGRRRNKFNLSDKSHVHSALPIPYEMYDDSIFPILLPDTNIVEIKPYEKHFKSSFVKENGFFKYPEYHAYHLAFSHPNFEKFIQSKPLPSDYHKRYVLLEKEFGSWIKEKLKVQDAFMTYLNERWDHNHSPEYISAKKTFGSESLL